MGWIQLIGIVGALVTALLGFLQSRQNKGKIQEVHVMVNNQRKTMLTRNKLLADTLRAHDIDVPAEVDAQEIS
jgi:hypothetical protein